MPIQTKKQIVLIVEDESSIRHPLSEKFAHEGFLVLEAENGEKGLAIAVGKHPDIILLDIIMPVMDGMTMLKKLRAGSEWGKAVPVIVLTNLSSGDEDRMKDIIQTQPSYYLVKTDWKMDDVVAKVREQLK